MTAALDQLKVVAISTTNGPNLLNDRHWWIDRCLLPPAAQPSLSRPTCRMRLQSAAAEVVPVKAHVSGHVLVRQGCNPVIGFCISQQWEKVHLKIDDWKSREEFTQGPKCSYNLVIHFRLCVFYSSVLLVLQFAILHFRFQRQTVSYCDTIYDTISFGWIYDESILFPIFRFISPVSKAGFHGCRVWINEITAVWTMLMDGNLKPGAAL